MEGTKSIVEGRATPSPEVLEKPVRRRFTVEYKVKILAVALTLTAEYRAAIAKGFPAAQPAASPPSEPATSPGPAEQIVRTWTDSSGKFQVKAVLVGVKDGKVALKRATGQTIAVPLDRLSEEDQAVVRQWLAEQ